MLKIAIWVLFALTSSFSIAQSDYYMLNDEQGCYVKEYVDKKFVDVPSTQFKAYKLRVIPNKKDPNTMFFKLNNRYYSTLKKCLKDASADLIDEQDLSSLQDSAESDVSSEKTRTEKKLTSKFGDRLYLELGIGGFSIADRNSVSDYASDSGELVDGYPLYIKKMHKSKMESKGLISLGGGLRHKNITPWYWAFKLKYYAGEKEDKVDVEYRGLDLTVPLKIKHTFVSMLLGSKFIFQEKSKLRPFIGIYAGPSMIDIKTDESRGRSINLSAQLDLGLEYFIKNNIALTATYSYEYLGKRRFKELKENKNGSDIETGEDFKSNMDYSNSAFLIGAKFYFN